MDMSVNMSTKNELRAEATRADPRWAAVAARDKTADGQFVYSVRTTGVYCRPSCPSRTARPENVEFHAGTDEAERAGFRPCRRCKPDALGLVAQQTALARDLQDRFPKARLIGGDADFERLVAQVVGFVEAPGLGLDLPLDVRGTAFQQRVWQALRGIPAGRTVSYAELAQRIGSPSAVRAVAQACGANALAVAIPCHRVVRSDGGLSGYRWGVERKRALLEREAKA